MAALRAVHSVASKAETRAGWMAAQMAGNLVDSTAVHWVACLVALMVACLAALKVEQTADYLVAPKVASKVESSAARTDDCSADSTAAHWAVH